MTYSDSAMSSTLAVPVTLWSDSQPTFQISSICVSPTSKKLVAGSYSGQLCLWDLDLEKGIISPKNILIGHNHSITCMVATKEYVISNCEGGKICRWNMDDGFCSKTNQFFFVHRHMELHKQQDQNYEWLFACGDYSEVHILHSVTLQVIFVLCSRNDYNWISNFCVMSSQSKGNIVRGITVNGHVKVWIVNELTNNFQFEVQSKLIQVDDIVDFVDLDCNSNESMLVVSSKYWMLFNSELSQCICKVEVFAKERLLGGKFCDLKVVVWTNFGKLYLYDISDKPILTSVIFNDSAIVSLFDPTMYIFETEKNKYLVRGDLKGEINICKIDTHVDKFCSILSTNLKYKWIPSEQSFFSFFIKHTHVTCCIYVLELDKLFIGCFDGTIASIPAHQSIMSFYFQSDIQAPSPHYFVGHKGKINCLVYPHEKYSYFSKSYLLSGGSDFSVCLWNVDGELLYKFCVQSGEILSLIIPPKDCNPHVKHSICSISSDHSVAVLNLKDKRCIILTSRHEFPVVSVNWKPLDDFLIIECYDGTVYVWQLETGHLDRVLDGVTAQEILYACNETFSDTSLCNFYYHEDVSLKQKLCSAQNKGPFTIKGFFNKENKSYIFMCDLECIMSCLFPVIDFKSGTISHEFHLLTETMDLSKKSIKLPIEYFQDKFQTQKNNFIKKEVMKKQDNAESFSETIINMLKFLLSSLHFWDLDSSLDKMIMDILQVSKPGIVSKGLVSCHDTFSLFLEENKNNPWNYSSLVSTTCITVIGLAKIFQTLPSLMTDSTQKKLEKLVSFYETLFINSSLNVSRPNIEIVAKAWSTKCLILQKIVRKLLTSHLQALDQEENAALLDYWYNYLPHFKILDKTLSEKVDFENLDLKTVALVLFGAIGSDLKFKANDSGSQENYIYQTCSSFVFLLLLQNEQKIRFDSLRGIAVDFLGRGYIVWEQFLKMEKIIPILFEMCSSKCNAVHKCLAALNTLKSIAIARTAAFINCLISEINKTKSTQNGYFQIENSKPVILSILTFLLEETPYIMMLYLNDVITLFVYCIDFSHLKQESLSNLIPVMKKFRQVHHSVSSQRIAVGLATGSLVLHDLKTGKAHEVTAHKDSISALKFSEDGKFLVSYSCYENRLSFWQVLTGIFGLGHVNVKCAKSCQTYQIHDEEIRNHLEIASLTWTDRKSVMLSLCDGTDTVFTF